MTSVILSTRSLRHPRAFVVLALALVAVLGFPTPADAALLQVCSTCTYTTIQGAVNAAASGDNIEIAAGTYNESVSISGAGYLGLFAASGRVTIDATGYDRALEILHASARILLVDIDLEKADGYAGLVNYGRATLVTVGVRNNSGTYGGILNVPNATLATYSNTVIAGNVATSYGSAGGLNNFGWVDLWNTTVLGNEGREGGGFKTNGISRVWVFSSDIYGNQASSMGGGFFNSSPQADVVIQSSSTVTGNSAPYCEQYYDVNLSPYCVD